MTRAIADATVRRAALYARVSTADQQPENQLGPLREYARARGWEVREFIDHGVSGTREKRPALDTMMAAARARKIDAVVCVRLDRLARSTKHLLSMAAEWETIGVDLVVTEQSVDTSTPTGRLLFTVLGAIAAFEHDLIRERVIAGLRRAKAQGAHIGRPRKHVIDVTEARRLRAEGQSLRAIAKTLATWPMSVKRALAASPVAK